MNRYLATISQNYRDGTVYTRTVEYVAEDDERARSLALAKLEDRSPIVFEKLEEVKFLSEIGTNRLL